MHTIIPVKDVAYKIIFHTVDAFQIWNDQLAHLIGLVEKLLAIQLFIFFKSVVTTSATVKQILRPSYLKIIFQCLRFLDHIKKNMFESDTNIVWTDQAFHGCKDSSIRWSRVCEVSTLNHAFGK